MHIIPFKLYITCHVTHRILSHPTPFLQASCMTSFLIITNPTEPMSRLRNFKTYKYYKRKKPGVRTVPVRMHILKQNLTTFFAYIYNFDIKKSDHDPLFSHKKVHGGHYMFLKRDIYICGEVMFFASL